MNAVLRGKLISAAARVIVNIGIDKYIFYVDYVYKIFPTAFS